MRALGIPQEAPLVAGGAEWSMGLAVYIRGHIVGLLRREAARVRLGHVVPNKGRHSGDSIHARARVVGIRSPESGESGIFSVAIRSVAQCALFRKDLLSANGVAHAGGQRDEPPARQRFAGWLALRQPLGVSDKRDHLGARTGKRAPIFAALEALVDALFEGDNAFLALAVHGK